MEASDSPVKPRTPKPSRARKQIKYVEESESDFEEEEDGSEFEDE